MSVFKQLIESKKFVVAFLGAVAAGAAVFHYEVPVMRILAVLTPIMMYIGAQGWADAGKERAKIEGETRIKLHQLTFREPVDAPKLGIARSPQAGSTLLSVLFLLGAAVFLFVAEWSCSSNPKIIAAETAAAACAIEQVQHFASPVKDALSQPDYTDALKQVATKSALTDAAIKCIVQTVIAVLTAPAASTPTPAPDAGVTASTERPSMVVAHGKAWLEAHP